MKPGPLLHPFARPASTDFLTIVSGQGAIVVDDKGRDYVDALAALWYCNIGHGRPEMADAVAQQMRRIETFHTFDKFSNETAEALAQKVVDLAPMDGARVMFTSSGSEAVDTAIKLARVAHVQAGHPERTVVVSRQQGYHGVTYGGLSVQGIDPNREGFGPLLPDVMRIGIGDLASAEEVFARHGNRIAAVITEPVMAAGGVYPPEAGYLEGLRRLCDAAGAFLIMDEVVCGFGRLGAWWGSQRFGIRPDLVTFAKAITSGYIPLGGVLVGPAVRQPLEQDETWLLRHGHTYSGHAVACAAGLEALAITEREELLERVPSIGAQLKTGLDELLGAGLLRAVRGDGAVWGAVMPEGVAAGVVRDHMLEAGVIARPLGADVIAFCPPLVITDGQIDRCIDSLRMGLEREVRVAEHAVS